MNIIGFEWHHNNYSANWPIVWREALRGEQYTIMLEITPYPRLMELINGHLINPQEITKAMSSYGDVFSPVDSLYALIKQEPRPHIIGVAEPGTITDLERERGLFSNIMNALGNLTGNIGYAVGNRHSRVIKKLIESFTNHTVELRPAGCLPITLSDDELGVNKRFNELSNQFLKAI